MDDSNRIFKRHPNPLNPVENGIPSFTPSLRAVGKPHNNSKACQT
jgi:hypothetical protein